MKKLLLAFPFILIAGFCQAQVDLKKLDGIISSDESKTLTAIGKNGANQLLIDTSSKDYLKVTIISEKLYVASLCICSEKNEVSVLHASAALGQIMYTKSTDSWSGNQKFDWQMRETGMDDATVEKRKAYLDKNGWVANTMQMGKDGEAEFIIDRKVFSRELKLAIGLMTAADPENIVGIPENIGDCAARSLVGGPPNSTYNFKIENWISVSE